MNDQRDGAAVDADAAVTEGGEGDVATLGAPVHAQVMAHLRDAVLLVDADGVVSYASPNVANVLDHTPEELIGTPIRASVAEPDVGAVERALRADPDVAFQDPALLFGGTHGPLALFVDAPVRLGPVGTRLLTFRPMSSEPLARPAPSQVRIPPMVPPTLADVQESTAEVDPVAAAELEAAIELGQLTVHYQPEVDLESATVLGAEGLARWQHPDRGVVPAGEFIELAEVAGLVRPLGRQVLFEACEEFGEWARRFGDTALTLRVNLSAEQLADPDVVRMVREGVDRSGTPAGSLCLEVTETVLMRDPRSLGVLEELRSHGVRIAVDDFGTGYSSLSQLKRLPVDVLKIDRSFVDGLGLSSEDTAIVRAIVELARAIGLGVVAEGVEHPRQVDELLRLGCRRGQGWLYGRAMPWVDLEERFLFG